MSCGDYQIICYRNVGLTDVLSLGVNIKIQRNDQVYLEMPYLGDVI